MATTMEGVTRAQVEALRGAALAAGDGSLAECCEVALACAMPLPGPHRYRATRGAHQLAICVQAIRLAESGRES